MVMKPPSGSPRACTFSSGPPFAEGGEETTRDAFRTTFGRHDATRRKSAGGETQKVETQKCVTAPQPDGLAAGGIGTQDLPSHEGIRIANTLSGENSATEQAGFLAGHPASSLAVKSNSRSLKDQACLLDRREDSG